MTRKEKKELLNDLDKARNELKNLNRNIREKYEDLDWLKKEDVKFICEHILDLAKIANKELEADEMDEFIKRNNQLMSMVISL